MGMGAKKYLNGDETEEELAANRTKAQATRDLIDEERKDEVDMTGEVCNGESILTSIAYPERWYLMSHITFNRQYLKDKVIEGVEEEDLKDGYYGCPCCDIIFFKIEDKKIVQWSTSEFKQLLVKSHAKDYLGLCCMNYD